MEFRLLGPFEVVVDGVPVNVGGRQRRTLLAILTVLSGETVSTERLIDELWGESPPSAARKSVQAHVAHLRRSINIENELLSAADDGYVLALAPDSIDSRRFEDRVLEGRAKQDADPAAAVAAFEDALGMFRGAPLAGLADDAFTLRVEASRLQEMRLSVIEDRLDTMMAMGRDAQAATEAGRLVSEHPLRERLWGTLMLAQYRTGRQADALRSYARARQTLVEELGIEPSNDLQRLEEQILAQDLETGSVTTRDRIGQPAPQPVRNPYKGLRAFDEADASDFFGREDLIRKLEERLDARGSGSLTVLAGPSGAGKSSVVRAGLVPSLRERGQSVSVMVPGDDPLAALARATTEPDGDLSEDPTGAAGVASHRAQTTVVVDQFEELFTMVDETRDIDKFIDFLVSESNSISWIVTVRADFLDHLLSDPRLGPLLEDALVLVPPLREHEVRAAVTRPAERVGVAIEPDLTAALINDVQARPASLPLLQYALTDTFERSDGTTLRLADYERSGGISGAIARRSDEMFSTLTSGQQKLAQQMFLQLVTVSDDGEVARRRVQRDVLLDLGSLETMSRIIERFGALRFLTFDTDPDTGAPTVEIAHEALTSEWPRLAGWIEQALNDLRVSRRLRMAVAEWEGSGHDVSFLLSGARLAEMEAWRDSTSLQPTPQAQALITESRSVQDAAERKRKLQRRVVAGMLSAAAAIAVVFAFLAQRSADEARDQAAIAQEQRAIAEEQTALAEDQAELAQTQKQNAEEAARRADARRLAALSLATIETDPSSALLDAIESVEISRRSGNPVLREAEEALRLAIQSIRTVLDLEGGGAAFFSPDGTRLVSGGPDDAFIWDVGVGDLVSTLVGHTGGVFNAVFSSDGKWVATASEDGTTRIWDARSGEEEVTLDTGAEPLSIAFSPSAEHLAVSYNVEGSVRVWETETWTQISQISVFEPLGINFDPSGDLLAVAAFERLIIYEVPSGDIHQEIFIEDPAAGFADVAFAPDLPLLLAGAGDSAWLYETGDWTLSDRLFGHVSNIEAIDTGREGLAATGAIDGQVRVWNIATGEELMVLSGQGAGVLNVSLHPEGNLVAAGSANESLRVWDITPSGRHEWYTLADHPGVTDADYGPDGMLLATGGFDEVARVWDSATGQLLTEIDGHGGPVRRVELGPGGLLATASFDGSARVWDALTGESLHVFAGQGGVGGVSISQEGSILAFSSGFVGPCQPGEGFVEVRDLAEGALIFSGVVADDSLVTDVSLGPDGTWFVAVSCGVLRRYTSNGELVWEVEAHGGFAPAILQVDVAPDGSHVVTGSWDGLVKVWDSVDGRLLRTFDAHTGEVWGVEFSADGSLVASAAHDGTARIWDVMGGFEVVSIPGHESAVDDVAFSVDGKRLATVGRDETVQVHALDIDDLIDLASEKLERFSNVFYLGD